MNLKEARIKGKGSEIYKYLESAMEGFENNYQMYELRFVLSLDPNLKILMDDWEEGKPNYKSLLFLLLGFGLGLFFMWLFVSLV